MSHTMGVFVSLTALGHLALLVGANLNGEELAPPIPEGKISSYNYKARGVLGYRGALNITLAGCLEY